MADKVKFCPLVQRDGKPVPCGTWCAWSFQRKDGTPQCVMMRLQATLYFGGRTRTRANADSDSSDTPF